MNLTVYLYYGTMVYSVGEMRMKITHLVYVVLAFGITVSLLCCNFPANRNTVKNYESENSNELAGTSEMVKQTDNLEEATNIDVAIATPSVEEKKEEPKPTPQPVAAKKTVTNQPAIVYDNLSMDQLSYKLNKVLKSNLSGTGNIFAKYSVEYGIDPYLAVAIVLHETGCNSKCSSAVRNKNNVGGMMGKGGLIRFNSLEEGIKAFIVNLKEKYYNYGLTTPEAMNKKYAANPNWHVKINSYMTKIKNA